MLHHSSHHAHASPVPTTLWAQISGRYRERARACGPRAWWPSAHTPGHKRTDMTHRSNLESLSHIQQSPLTAGNAARHPIATPLGPSCRITFSIDMDGIRSCTASEGGSAILPCSRDAELQRAFGSQLPEGIISRFPASERDRATVSECEHVRAQKRKRRCLAN